MRSAESLRHGLRASDLFSAWSDADLDELIQASTRSRFDTGQLVFKRGSAADRVYSMISGRVKVSSFSDAGNEIILRVFDAGETFGEIGVLDGGPRTAAAIATEPSELMVLERRHLFALLQARPGLALKLLERMATRLRSTTELLEDVLFQNVPARLARKLLELADSYGRPMLDGVRIELRLPQDVLGNLVGTSRVSINQQVRSWKDRGLIRVSRSQITLLDLDALRRLSRGEGL